MFSLTLEDLGIMILMACMFSFIIFLGLP